MKSKKLRIPSSIHHKASGQDVVFLRDETGKRRMVYLGKNGSTEASRRYRAVLADYLAGKPVATRATLRTSPRETLLAVRGCCTKIGFSDLGLHR